MPRRCCARQPAQRQPAPLDPPAAAGCLLSAASSMPMPAFCWNCCSCAAAAICDCADKSSILASPKMMYVSEAGLLKTSGWLMTKSTYRHSTGGVFSVSAGFNHACVNPVHRQDLLLQGMAHPCRCTASRPYTVQKETLLTHILALLDCDALHARHRLHA